MDQGYLDFTRLFVIHETKAFHLIRAKSNAKFKRPVFLSTDFILKSELIADLYPHRWQAELFFKWVKLHARI